MRVSFIIPLYNCLPLTQAMLASLRATLPADLAHEIILVDDGSTDGTRDWLRGLTGPCHPVLNERNLGFAGACNRGGAVAQGEYLFFLNNDLVLLPHWLEPMLDLLGGRADAGLVGNVQLNAATGAVDHAGLTFDEKGKPVHLTRRGLASVRPITAVTGACFGLRAALWRELGGFDPGFVNGCEDVDLCLRATQLGRRNYVALRSVVRHHISASIGRKLRDEENTARLLRRWRDVIVPLAVRPGCGPWLAAAWDEPRNYADPGLAREAALHLLRVMPWATPRLLAAAHAMIDIEFARWAQLLSGAPARDPRQIAPMLFPILPEDPPVF